MYIYITIQFGYSKCIYITHCTCTKDTVLSSLGHWQEHRADNRAGLCGRRYSEGGITFAQKRIELEKRLRALE